MGKEGFWGLLSNMVNVIFGPWLAIGDLSYIGCNEDKRGGHCVGILICLQFGINRLKFL